MHRFKNLLFNFGLNINGNIISEPQDIENQTIIKNSLQISTQKPYTSAPKMVETSLDDENLMEIPLSNTSTTAFKCDIDISKLSKTFISEVNNCRNLPVNSVLAGDSKIVQSVDDGFFSGSDIKAPLPIANTFDNLEIVQMKNSTNSFPFMRNIDKDIEDLRRAINSKDFLSNYSENASMYNAKKNKPMEELPSCSDNTVDDFINRQTFNTKNYSAEFSNKIESVKSKEIHSNNKEYESDEDTDKLLMKQYERNEKIEIPELKENKNLECEKKKKGKEVKVRHPDYPSNLIEGLLFRANYLGSTQLTSDNRPSKDTRMMQAQEAVGRVKSPDSESQPSVAVDLFISTEKILILNTNLSEIMMDHNLKTISYIADIGNILVLMARRIFQTNQTNSENRVNKSQSMNKIICHVFESDEAQLIAHSIGKVFQIAYIEFLKANGIDDPKILKEVDYQDVLNDQEISGDELRMFANKDQHKEVVIPKRRGESLGVVIVESGWGSMLPTVVLANMNPNGPAARCGSLNIGNQLIAINGHSLVGLPLSECQQLIKRCKIQTAVKVTVVNCPPVVEVYIRRPDSKYQLGFSVQNGVICSLLRGGIAERGGIRVGHHIIEINGVSVVAVSHEKIVNMLATAVGEIHIRTMPTSIFRLLTGQETPHYI